MSDRTLVATQVLDAAANATARAKLQVWLSPAFPVGAFAYSHGLERAVEAGWVGTREGLHDWLLDLIAHGAMRNDLILLAAAWRATASTDLAALLDAAELSAALQPSAERRLEATQQGASFLTQMAASWPVETGIRTQELRDREPSHAVAVGFAAAAHGVPLDETLSAVAVAFLGTMTSAAIRLSIIGQSDAQRITAALLDALQSAAHMAAHATLDDLGAASWRSDIASMQHETQHTRLFRS